MPLTATQKVNKSRNKADAGPSSARGSRSPSKRKQITDGGPQESSDPTSAAGKMEEMVPDQTATIKALTATLDELRDTITCKICFRFLYMPFTAQCGHTYCYSCLSQWLNESGTKRSCPNCRERIVYCPAPAYLVREMTHKFIQNPELLPPGETVEKHQQMSIEEQMLVDRDRENTDPAVGGLFKGAFKRPLHRPPIHDDEDGVLRCPNCSWEMEEGECLRCGHVDTDWDEDYDEDEDEDEDEELGSETNSDIQETTLGHFFGHPEHMHIHEEIGIDDDFHDHEVDASFAPPHYYDDSEDTQHALDSEMEMETDVEFDRTGLRLVGPPRIRTSRRLLDDDDDDDDDDDEEEEDDYDEDMDSFIDDDDDDDDEEPRYRDGSDGEEGESDGEAEAVATPTQPARPTPIVRGRRGRPIIVDSDDDDDNGTEDNEVSAYASAQED